MSTRTYCPCGDYADIEHACPVTYAKLREELVEANVRLSGRTCYVPPEFQAELLSWKQRAEAAEELVRQARAQEPSSFICLDETGSPYGCKLAVEVGERVIPQYTLPIPPADVQELQADFETYKRSTDLAYQGSELQSRERIAELERMVAESYEQGKRDAVPEGWQAVPKAAPKLNEQNKQESRDAKE